MSQKLINKSGSTSVNDSVFDILQIHTQEPKDVLIPKTRGELQVQEEDLMKEMINLYMKAHMNNLIRKMAQKNKKTKLKYHYQKNGHRGLTVRIRISKKRQ